MVIPRSRLIASVLFSLKHLAFSVAIAALAAWLVFGVWYPWPYREMAGGRALFTLIVAVDVVCGPLLSLVLYNPAKPRAELLRDLGLVVLIQLAALAYGVHTMWQARPLYLVHEVDRFKVIALADALPNSLERVDPKLAPNFFSGPRMVGLRELSREEQQKIMFESVMGGHDAGERPEYFVAYDTAYALRYAHRKKPLAKFLARYPQHQNQVAHLTAITGLKPEELHYLPVVARKEWVAVLDKQGLIAGYLEGDGF
jgi:hypothetical protein